MIREAFKQWIFRDLDRREAFAKESIMNYSMRFVRVNTMAVIFKFAGMTPEISLMSHQKNADCAYLVWK